MERRSLLPLCTLLTISSPGCALMDLIDGGPVAPVRFFATHAGTPGDGGYPNYGQDGDTRVFMNDTGWQIALGEVCVTTAEVHLVRCAEPTGTPIEMLGTKCPSITSTCNIVAPAFSTAAISAAKFAKFAARMDGAISTGDFI